MKNFKRIITLITTLVLITLSAVLFTSCEEKEKFVDKEIVYNVVGTESKILEKFSFSLFIDEKNSTITLREDGTASIYLKTKNNLDQVLKLALNNADLSSFDITPYEDMAKQFFPGFSIGDMETGLKMLKNNVGVNIVGFDFTDKETVEMFKQFNETKRLPEKTKFPDFLALEYNANYYLKDVYSETEGSYKGVFIGKHEENGEPYIVMTQFTDKDGIKTIKYFNKMLNLVLVAKQL